MQDNPLVDVTGAVEVEGEYVVVAQYFQPDHPLVTLAVNITQQDATRGDQEAVQPDIPVYEAVLPLPTCASNIGCRAAVLDSRTARPADIHITETFDISFTNDGPEGAWIETVYAMPAQEFHENQDRLLNADDSIDQIERYEAECGAEAFYLPDDLQDGFCKQAVTSISALFNEGALECDCDAEGSEDAHDCNSFGGQCYCKPHVIGRTCSRCEPEYFGFPECQQCSCPPTATCNEETGDCICAPFVTGSPEDPCSQCEENTFGYDAITGCQECNCEVEGTVEGDQSCSLESGQCNCQPSVEGRTCDHCTPGYYGYPDCLQCACDLRGTTEQICDQSSAQCHCKNNVEDGGECDTCKDGHFNLQESNPDGCMECFCFGKTSICSSNQNLQRTHIVTMEDWTGVTFTFGRTAEKTDLQMESLVNYNGMLDMPFNSLINADLSTSTFYFQGSNINLAIEFSDFNFT